MAFLVEVLAINFFKHHNTWLYNTYLPMDFACTTFLVTSALSGRSLKYALVALTSFGIATILEVFLRNDPDALITTTFSLGCLVMVALLVYALFRLSNDAEVHLLRSGAFWLLLGQLIYFGGMLPYNSLVDYMYAKDPILTRSLSEINLVLATLRYASMTLALLVHMRFRPAAQTA